jgi:VWFA-related protein
MKLPFMALVLAVLTTTQAPQRGTAPVSGHLTLDLVAVDRHGAPVADLRPDELEVWISGYRVPVDEVAFVTPDTSPRTIALVLDNVAIGPDLAMRVKEAGRAFASDVSERDRVTVGPVEGPRADVTGQPARLAQAVDGYHVQGFPVRIEDASEHVLRTFTALARQMTEIRGRKAIVAIGAAWMFDTPLPPPNLRDLRAEWVQAMRSMAANNVSLYVVDPVGLRPMRGFSMAGDAGFANETGGYAFLNTNDLQGVVKKIVDETGTYYLLRVVDPPVQRAADLRKLEIKTTRKDVTLRSRRGIAGR